jgi:hypothetical protein
MGRVTVTLGMTAWNTVAATTQCVAALMNELDRLKAANISADVVLLDNASWDGTGDVLRETYRRHAGDVQLVEEGAPTSSSCCRNVIIEQGGHADYLVLLDGDIQVIPHSIVAMVRHLEEHPSLMALAMNPVFQTNQPDAAAQYCRSVRDTSVDALMYLCGYGLFRSEVFETVTFDEGGPLGQCGWGSEDDDFYLGMVEAQMPVRYVDGYRFLHHQPRSSWASLRKLGIDPIKSFEARRGYVLAKWRNARPVHLEGRFSLIAAQHLHE